MGQLTELKVPNYKLLKRLSWDIRGSTGVHPTQRGWGGYLGPYQLWYLSTLVPIDYGTYQLMYLSTNGPIDNGTYQLVSLSTLVPTPPPPPLGRVYPSAPSNVPARTFLA